MFIPPPEFIQGRQGQLLLRSLRNVLKNRIAGTEVLHYQAQRVAIANLDPYGKPDYLAPDGGVYGSGVNFVANPLNPLRGVFCRAPKRPQQDKAGIYMTAQMELYLADYPGEVFKVEDTMPKLQDAFDILGSRYYAIAPAMPCQMGEITAAWKIELSLERYPVNA